MAYEIASVHTEAEVQEKQLEKAFIEAARHHLDEVLGIKEWEAFDLSRLTTQSPPTDFSWLINVRPSFRGTAFRVIEITMFNRGGNFGGYEYTVEDQSLPMSDPLKLEEARRKIRESADMWAKREEIEMQLERAKILKILMVVIHEQRDELLGGQEFFKYGLNEIYEKFPINGHWFVAVLPGYEPNDKKLVLEMYDEQGKMYGLDELPLEASDLPLSDEQRVIDIRAEIAEIENVNRQELEKRQRVINDRQEKERGFPAGEYALQALFIDIHGSAQTLNLNRIVVEDRDTRADVENKVFQELESLGIQNFHLGSFERKAKYDYSAPVHLNLKNKVGIEVAFDVRVNGSGYVVD